MNGVVRPNDACVRLLRAEQDLDDLHSAHCLLLYGWRCSSQSVVWHQRDKERDKESVAPPIYRDCNSRAQRDTHMGVRLGVSLSQAVATAIERDERRCTIIFTSHCQTQRILRAGRGSHMCP
jgi:hypothetical protein